MSLLSRPVDALPPAEERPSPPMSPDARRFVGPAILALLGAALWGPVLFELWPAWMSDKSLSHAILLIPLALWLLWGKKDSLMKWDEADSAGLAWVIAGAVLHAGAFFADVVFLKSLSLLVMTLGAIRYLGGRKAFAAAVGPLGLLLFAIPWPTTLVEKLAFPLQLTSSAYAALLSGALGLPIHREGVHLSVMGAGGKPIYSILVAQGCSGLTSLTVLLALAYLISLHTPVKFGWRGLMIASILPMTLLANAVRLTLILEAGAHFSAELAQWVHDNEAPVLIFFCSLGLMGLRQALLAWSESREAAALGGEGAVRDDGYSPHAGAGSSFPSRAREDARSAGGEGRAGRRASRDLPAASFSFIEEPSVTAEASSFIHAPASAGQEESLIETQPISAP